MIRNRLTVLLGCLLLLCSCTISTYTWAREEQRQEKSLIPREVLFGNPEKAAPHLSPDGSLLAYLAPNDDNVLNVWLRDLSGVEHDRPITSNQKQGIHHFYWQLDNEHILYTQDRDGDENEHLYQTNIHTRVTRDLTPFEGAKAMILAYKAKFPKEMLIGLNVRNAAIFDVYRLDLESGVATLAVENHENALQWLVDSELCVRGFVRELDGCTIVQMRDDNDSPWREVLRSEVGDEVDVIGFSPDYNSLYICSSVDSNTSKLVQLNLADGSRKTLVEHPDYDVHGNCIIRNPISGEIEAVGVNCERLEWVFLDPALERDFVFLQGRHGREEEVLAITSRDLSDQKWVLTYFTDHSYPRYYLYDRATRESQFLFSVNSRLDVYPLCEMKPVLFKARDGMPLHGYLTLPLDCEPQNLPTVLFVHGGPWARDSWCCHPFVQWLANRGYAVLQVNFRGSTGYGKSFLEAGNREWAGKMQTDLLDGKQWLVDLGYTHPDKVAIFGGSYGGYAALVGLTFTPEEFCCGVDLFGPSNLVTLLQTIPPYWIGVKFFFDRRVGNLETEREFLESRSPLFKADKICRPLLIAQGANDPRVKQAESDQIVEAIRQHGKEVEYLLFSNEGHGFSHPENLLKFCEVCESFLHKHLGGKKGP